ncbi:MAG: hemerythrin domain-containing protein, partial [Rhodospirillales bacterium]
MSIFTLLKDDHDSLRERIAAVKRSRGQDRKTLARHYSDLRTELLVHHEAEQHVLFTHLARLESLGDQALHAVEEHGEHRKLIEMMEDTPSYGDDWWASFDELAHDILHHLDE